MIVTLDHTHEEATNIQTFFFKPSQPLRYTAGQFIELTLPHDNPDNRGVKRWFTLSSSPSQQLLSITTRFNPDRSSTFKQTLFGLKPGAELTMSDAMGDFVLPKQEDTPIIFVAGGIGITPMHSMLTWLHDTGEVRPIKVIYAVRNEDDIIFLETFQAANQYVTIVVGEPSAAWGGERGRISAETILGIEKPSDTTLVYLSGPEPMTEALAKELIEQGLNRNQVVLDSFPGYASI